MFVNLFLMYIIKYLIFIIKTALNLCCYLNSLNSSLSFRSLYRISMFLSMHMKLPKWYLISPKVKREQICSMWTFFILYDMMK